MKSSGNMKERPILFSTPMVQAILAGRKTQTRRIVKPQPFANGNYPNNVISNCLTEFRGGWTWAEFYNTVNDRAACVKCKQGNVGDVLWVRETFSILPGTENEYYYKANGDVHAHKWKPSLFMPRAACRILLQVENVRVERLNNISEQDCINEGIRRIWDDDRPLSTELHNYTIDYKHGSMNAMTAKECFEFIWKEINGEKSWNENPFVWVIEFKANPI